MEYRSRYQNAYHKLPSNINTEIQADDNKKVCLNGVQFFNAIKYLVSRFILLSHGVLMVRHTVQVYEDSRFWALLCPVVFILVEVFVVLFYRDRKEWKW